MKPLVSILIPAYNAQATIAYTLRSALAQTWPRKEIIVVDDGSRDETPTILRAFESENVLVVRQSNQGAAAARNKAYSASSGDFVQWLDADDLLAPDKIALQMEAMAEPARDRALLSCAWGRFLYRNSHAKFVPTPLWCDLSPEEWLVRQMEHNVYMQTATWLVSRKIADAAGPWDTRLLGDDDGEYFSRVLLASDGTRFVPNARVYYRQTGASSLSYIGHSDRKRDAQWLSMVLHIKYLRSIEDSQRVRAACITYLQNWMVYFYPERADLFEQAQMLAKELGGALEAPSLSWKYAWIKTLFGWPLARRAQVTLPRLRWSLAGLWDKACFQLEDPSLTTNPSV
jgi:glycosyltransferase involved in cell wall biosynthesis